MQNLLAYVQQIVKCSQNFTDAIITISFVRTTELSPPSQWLATIKHHHRSILVSSAVFRGAVSWKLPLTAELWLSYKLLRHLIPRECTARCRHRLPSLLHACFPTRRRHDSITDRLCLYLVTTSAISRLMSNGCSGWRVRCDEVCREGDLFTPPIVNGSKTVWLYSRLGAQEL